MLLVIGDVQLESVVGLSRTVPDTTIILVTPVDHRVQYIDACRGTGIIVQVGGDWMEGMYHDNGLGIFVTDGITTVTVDTDDLPPPGTGTSVLWKNGICVDWSGNTRSGLVYVPPCCMCTDREKVVCSLIGCRNPDGLCCPGGWLCGGCQRVFRHHSSALQHVQGTRRERLEK